MSSSPFVSTDAERVALPSLPRNLLLNIFSRLKSVRDLLRCALVCKGWSLVVLSSETLWSSLYLKRWQPSPIFKRGSVTDTNNMKEMTTTSDILNEGSAVIYLRGEDYQRGFSKSVVLLHCFFTNNLFLD